MRKHFLLFTLILVTTCAGCASQPISTTLPAIMQNPEQYKNQNVSITAPVLSNRPPSGDLYRTWNFLIGSPDVGRILVTKAGYNPATINKAYQLVEEAREAGEPVTVTGRLRVGPYKSLQEGAEIDLDSVAYKNITVDTDQGPYVGGFYSPYYYYSPFYYPQPYFWDYGHYRYGPGWWGEYRNPDEDDAENFYAGYLDFYHISSFDEEVNEDTDSPAVSELPR